MTACHYFSPSAQQLAMTPGAQPSKEYSFDRPLPSSHCSHPQMREKSLVPMCLYEGNHMSCPLAQIPPPNVLQYARWEHENGNITHLKLTYEREMSGVPTYKIFTELTLVEDGVQIDVPGVEIARVAAAEKDSTAAEDADLLFAEKINAFNERFAGVEHVAEPLAEVASVKAPSYLAAILSS